MLLLKELFDHVEILIKHRASDVARRDLGDQPAPGPAVHIRVSYPNLGQLPLASKIAYSNVVHRPDPYNSQLPDGRKIEPTAAQKVRPTPITLPRLVGVANNNAWVDLIDELIYFVGRTLKLII